MHKKVVHEKIDLNAVTTLMGFVKLVEDFGTYARKVFPVADKN